ncbi:restriction endonuclease subunit S [Aliivibrio fischeri]|uniref:restriction endonuclease subunit S n=1 Tax=Aliivibrio fischeri TaxID=668 RepID=UPI0012D91780|nr:restriction endonuclease subunit S [Aliivibrio fischeri]MUI53319.1 hypothetical protein [Aliivibrio fischeri]
MSEFVPEGWKRIQLNDFVLKFQNGYAFSAKGYVSDGIPIVSMGSIQLDGRFKKNNLKLKYWPETELLDLERYLVEGGDLIMAMTDVTPTMELIGRACIVESKKKYLLNQRVGLVSVDESIACKSYIAYCSNFDEWRTYCIGSSGLGAQANLGTAQILGGYLTLPQLPEQQKIAAILTSVDEVIEKTQAQINKLKDLKTGMMQELLTRGVGVDGKPHTEFKDSPVGRIPKAWDCVQMDTICEKITDGEHQTPIRTNDGYYLLSARNVRDGCIDLTNVDYVGEAEFQRISKRVSPKQGDVLISCSGSVGRVAVVPPGLEFSMVRSVAILQLKSECVDSEFMALQVSATATQYQIEQSLSQQAQANLFQGAIKKLIVVVPSLLEQQQIANIVNSMTVKIITQQNKLKATKSLKKALMQDLLTGKVRVKVDS